MRIDARITAWSEAGQRARGERERDCGKDS